MSEQSAQDSTAKVQDIIQQLEGLIKTILEESSQASAASLVKRIFSFAKEYLFSTAAAPVKERLHNIHQTLDSVSTVLPLITDFQRGDPEQRKLAARVIQGIEEYNSLVDKLNLPLQPCDPAAILNRKIELPRSIPSTFMKYVPGQSKVSGAIRSVFAESLSSPAEFGVREEDLFRMKAISLLKETLGLKLAICAVKNTPIQKVWDETQSSQQIIHTRQTFCTFPGEVRVLTGVFHCKSNEKKLVDVKCTVSVHQTGFPAPSQHTGGITLSKAFLKQEPFANICEKQDWLASALLPEGEHYALAKQLIEDRRQVFNQHLDRFLPLLQNFTFALLVCGLERDLLEEEQAIISQFFSQYKDFNAIAEVHYWMSQHLSGEDFQFVKVHGKLNQFCKTASEYIFLIYPCLASSLERILSGSSLTDFDRTLMDMAQYQQLQFFQDFETEAPSLEKVKEQMLSNLRYEIDLLKQMQAHFMAR